MYFIIQHGNCSSIVKCVVPVPHPTSTAWYREPAYFSFRKSSAFLTIAGGWEGRDLAYLAASDDRFHTDLDIFKQINLKTYDKDKYV